MPLGRAAESRLRRVCTISLSTAGTSPFTRMFEMPSDVQRLLQRGEC